MIMTGKMWEIYKNHNLKMLMKYTRSRVKVTLVLPFLSPVCWHLNVIILRSRFSILHSLSIRCMTCIVIMSCLRSSPTLNNQSSNMYIGQELGLTKSYYSNSNHVLPQAITNLTQPIIKNLYRSRARLN
jgi:hypothetical protein